ncbi:MAG: hypothetical protein M0032_05360 [Actinomycetota bacterium]|nr:hypothetical protein [Actinomycetota bacterium]
MAHRIDIELTAQVSPDAWTWHAAGARQPRGTVVAALVPDGTTPGTVLRAEVETTLDGTTVLALAPKRAKDDSRPADRIEVLGTPRSGPDVNVVLASKGRGDRRGTRPRGGPDGRTGDGRTGGGRTGDSRTGDARRGDGRRRQPAARSPQGGSGRPGRSERPDRRPGRGGPTGRPQPAASTVHRNAALAALQPEELPVAEQLLRGGIPAVRQAIEEQNARARADGRAEVTPAPLLALAERLLPVVNLATWKDRAATARATDKDLPLRELRSLVAASSTVILDEEGRELAAALRTQLDARVMALREQWVNRIVTALDEGRVDDALRASARSPEPATRLPAELAVRLAEAAGATLSPDASPEAWLAILETVLETPVRRSVKPAGLPAGADERVLAAARNAAGAVPELARLLGIPIPPPPGPRRVGAGRPAGAPRRRVG